RSESKAVVQRYAAAVAAGDVQTARELFAPSATWTLAAGDLPIGGTWEGRDAIIDEFLATAQSYYVPDSIAIEITGLVAEADHVVMQWTSRARTRAGRTYENGCIGVFTIAGGQIQDVREYMDTLYARDVAFGAEDYDQPSAADTSAADSSIRSTAAGRL
ncbi:MAG: nuclear transport factor 2 family protein, partial [Solirubrobacteraceae bacterium]